jgi:hypothetical protein
VPAPEAPADPPGAAPPDVHIAPSAPADRIAASTAASRLVAKITRFGESTSGVSIDFASVVGEKPCVVVSMGNVLLVGRVGNTDPVVGGPDGETTHALLSPRGVENGSRSPTLTFPPDSVL